MSVKNRDQVENLATLVLLVLVVGSGLFLALVLFASPTL